MTQHFARLDPRKRETRKIKNSVTKRVFRSVTEPLVTTARIEAVLKLLSDRFTTVVTDTSEGKEHAKMTCDWMKMLMLTLPFMVCDLIAPKL
jgi:hypothetical protein